MGTQAIAYKFKCSESWVWRVKQEYREQGKTGPATRRKRIPKWHAIAADIKRVVEANPDFTLRELKEELQTSFSLATLCKALKSLGLTLKKKS